MFDIGWSELAIVALIALLVIGPKELPATMRMIAGWIGKVRGLAREFQSGLDDMMRETELDKLKEQAQGVMHGDLDGMVENTIDPDGKIREELDYGAGYEPFSDFDDPEPETKPAAKKGETPAIPEVGAAEPAKAQSAKTKATKARSTKAQSTKAQSTKAQTTKAKSTKAAASKPGTSGATAAKSRAKPAAKSATTKSASNGVAKTPAKPRAKAGTKTAAKKTAAAKPDTSGAAESDS